MARDWKAPLSMVLVQVFNTGMIILSKLVIDGGMYVFSLLTYRSLFGAFFILPFALLFERGKWRELDWNSSGWIFFNAFIGYAVPMGFYYYGLADTTASYAVIFLNVIPLATFILSAIVGMEKLQFGTVAGSMKIMGTLVTFGGTLVISLYKGKALHLWPSVTKLHHKGAKNVVRGHRLRGSFLLVGSCLSFACWYMIQSKVLKQYPYKYWSSMATCTLGGVQTAVVGLILNRGNSEWKLGCNLQLLTIIYSGALATATKYCMNSWVVEKHGPGYPPMFSSLSTVFTIVLDSVFLGEEITVGSIIGTFMVIIGLYLFLCGKSKERASLASPDSSIHLVA